MAEGDRIYVIPTKTGSITIKASKPKLGKVEGELADVSDFINDWSESLGNIESFISNLVNNFTEKEAQEQILHRAFNLTTNELARQVRFILSDIIIYAAKQTVEYNYAPYLTQLQRAINAHWQDAISIEYSDTGIYDVSVDLDAFGFLFEWGWAVKQTRDLMRTGLMGEPRRSQVWAEKIYGVDREGVRITKTVRDNKGKTTSTNDITDRYEGLYGLTVITRLSFLRQNTAPFIHLIRTGNAGAKIDFSDHGGTAYPTFAGIDFVPKIQDRITEVFDALFSKYLKQITNQYDDYFLDLGISPSARGLDEEIASRVDQVLEREDRAVISEQLGQRSFERINVEGGEVQLYFTKRGRIAARRFTINESGKHTQISYKYSLGK